MQRCSARTKLGSQCRAPARAMGNCYRHSKVECPVCFETVSSQNTSVSKRLSCGHSFHIDCILRWFKESDSCPVCRTNQEDDIFIEYKKDIEENLRLKYQDAIRSLEVELEEVREHERRPF